MGTAIRRYAIAYPKYMKDLYQRLRALGFDAPFVRANLLPDWWEDSLASVPANRALAETSIARMLGIPIRDLRKPGGRLRLPRTNNVRLKRRRGANQSELAPSIVLAERVADAVVRAVIELPEFRGPATASDMRDDVLKTHRFVGLGGLLEYAWSHGIIVFHLGIFPAKVKKITGMALFREQRPVIVLASGYDSPSWLAFHLAHELGDIMLGHVSPGGAPLADGDIDCVGNDQQETEADEFACQVLVEGLELTSTAVYGMTARRLASEARVLASSRNIDAGTIALMYGRSTDRMPVAQNALKYLGLNTGGRELITSALRERIADDLPEALAQALLLANIDE